jgi:hypothetical protein
VVAGIFAPPPEKIRTARSPHGRFPRQSAGTRVAPYRGTVISSAISTSGPRALQPTSRITLKARRIAGFLVGAASVVAIAWLVIIVSQARAGAPLDPVTRLVVAADAVVLLPLIFLGARWLRRQQPLGVLLAALLLVKSVATFLTLAVTSLMTWGAGGRIAGPEIAAHVAGLVIAALLLFNCLASLEEPPSGRSV